MDLKAHLTFLQQNATQAWNHRRTSTAPTGSAYVQSLAAAAGASILQFVPPDNYTGNIAGNGLYEADNARRTLASGVGMVNESTQTGFNGRGYVAGWNTVSLTISLQAGSNTIQVGYDTSKGNNNWLNVYQLYGL